MNDANQTCGLAVISAALLALMACPNNANPASPATNTDATTPTTAASATGEPPQRLPEVGALGVEMSENEYSITVPRTNFTLRPGTYERWCSIGNHRARGVQQTVTVSG